MDAINEKKNKIKTFLVLGHSDTFQTVKWAIFITSFSPSHQKSHFRPGMLFDFPSCYFFLRIYHAQYLITVCKLMRAFSWNAQ